MPWAQTLSDLSPYLSLHTSACALVSACCSFLPSFSQHVSHETWDSPSCPSLPLTHTACVHAYTQSTCACRRRVRTFSCAHYRGALPSPCYCQLCRGPIIQSVHDHAQRSLHLEHQQSARCLCWVQNTVVVHYWKPSKVTWYPHLLSVNKDYTQKSAMGVPGRPTCCFMSHADK